MPKYSYDKKRGNSADRGYGHAHRIQRKEFLRKHKTCARCGAPSKVMDEVIAGLGHIPSNLQALCKSCHSRKTALHDGGFGHSLLGGIRRWLKKFVA